MVRGEGRREVGEGGREKRGRGGEGRLVRGEGRREVGEEKGDW